MTIVVTAAALLGGCDDEAVAPAFPDGGTSSLDAGRGAGGPDAVSDPAELFARPSRGFVLGWFRGIVDPVSGRVSVELISSEEARSGEWRDGAPIDESDRRFAVRDFGLCDEDDYVVIQDGNSGTNPPNSIELATPLASLATDAECVLGWNPLFDPPLFCADVTVRSFYSALVLEQVYAEILSMSDINHLGWNSDVDPNGPLLPPSDVWGLWGYGNIPIVSAAPANAVARRWIFERNNDTFYSFVGRIVGTASEACDGIDNDCSGVADDNAGPWWWRDADGDTFGDLGDTTQRCTQPPGYVPDSTDCDDAASAINPLALEICDAYDNNCDGNLNEGSCWPPTVGGAAPDQITSDGARLHGVLSDLGDPATVIDHGFCWAPIGTLPNHGVPGATCQGFGAGTGLGPFEMTIAGVLDGGTIYDVAGWAENDSGYGYSVALAFETIPDPPENVEASDGALADRVSLTWDASTGATMYDVYRDAVRIADDVAGTAYDDMTAANGGPPGAPGNFEATDGVLFDRVSLTWDAAAPAPGGSHVYSVVAQSAAGESAQSASDVGFRAAGIILDYEASVDGGGSWGSVGLGLAWDDFTALAGLINPLPASATDGATTTDVFATTVVSWVDGSTSDYRVRAVNAFGTGPSSADTGFRGVGPLSYQWERSSVDADGSYFDLAGATSTSVTDATAPAGGEGRYYQLRCSAPGAATIVSAPDRGFRAATPTIATVAATTVLQSSAVFNANVAALGAPNPTQHGFCFSTSDMDPRLGDAGVTCTTIGGLGAVGPISEGRAGLAAGTTYYVQFYTQTPVAGDAYGGVQTFLTIPPAPVGVAASDGSSSTQVNVSWSASTGATTYDVYRDAALIASDVVGLAFSDTGAAQGGAPNAPTGFAASDGSRNNDVRLSWTAPTIPAGATHTYTVVAKNGSGSSPQSAGDTGYRSGPPITVYEFSRNNGGSWSSTGGASSPYDDSGAAAGSITPGTATATDATSATFVQITLSGASTTPGATHQYLVRGVNASGTGTSSAMNTGYRGVGSLAYQWQRSAGDSPAGFASIGGATTTSYNDTGAPADGSGRYYQCIVSASGAASQASTNDRGNRAVAPSVTTTSSSGVTATGATLNGNLASFGSPIPTAHGFVFSSSDATPTIGEGGVTNVNLGAPAVTGPFSGPASSLTPGTTYYFAAYATNAVTGTTYGTTLTLLTIPSAPAGVSATDGSSSSNVVVSWLASPGATTYNVYRDAVLIQSGIAVLNHTDSGATAGGSPPAPTGFAASDGSDTNGVNLTWIAPTPPNGATHSYTVVAVNPSGSSAQSVADTGYRAGNPLTHYEWSPDSLTWSSTGSTATSYLVGSADMGNVTVGGATASDGTWVGYVSASVPAPAVTPGAMGFYYVRGVNASGSGTSSGADTGYRGVGSPTYQWERSSGDSNGSFTTLAGATTQAHNDTTAPSDGSGRFYRCVVSAPGANPATSTADRGYRGVATVLEIASGGYNFSCAIAPSRTVQCWGENNWGQLGDGTTTSRTTPVTVSGVSNVVDLSLGSYYACAALADGTAKCWGYGLDGQLGDGSSVNRPTPVTVSGLTNAVSISASGDHTCALRADGTVRCWGMNGFGQLGNGSFTPSSTPVTVSGLTNALQVEAGSQHSCALLAGGTVTCWGDNQWGQVGDGTGVARSTPVAVTGLSGVLSIACSSGSSYAVRADGAARSWGRSNAGQIGDGSNTDRLSPVTVSGLSNVVQISSLGESACARLASGTAYCWGENSWGQVGIGNTTSPQSTPVAVPGLTGVVSISAGGSTFARLADGSARAWGANTNYQLGDGSTTMRTSPVQVTALNAGASMLNFDEGHYHTCAVRSTGVGYCMGYNSAYQIGDGTQTNRTTMTPVSGLAGLLDIEAGDQSTCSLLSDGTVRCWGSGGFGQLGHGSSPALQSTPVTPTGLSNVRGIAAGRWHYCALLGDGTVKCWGYNDNGQLGNGTTTNSNVPVVVSGLSNVVEIEAGYYHSCARLASGSISCWGENLYGGIGNGGGGDALTPASVSGISTAREIALGSYGGCALMADGTGRCWGDGTYGQNGDGTTSTRTTPVTVSSLSNARSIHCYGIDRCVLLGSGSGVCWGYNGNGNLGDGTTTNRSSPVAVGGYTNLVELTTGGMWSHMYTGAGAYYGWGFNMYGQVGDGSTTDRLNPVSISMP